MVDPTALVVDSNHNPCGTTRQTTPREEDSGCCGCHLEHTMMDMTMTDGRHEWGKRKLKKEDELAEIIMFKPGDCNISGPERMRITDCSTS